MSPAELLEKIAVPALVPVSERGEARIEHFTITPADAKHQNFMMSFRPGTGLDHLEPGRYARLYVGNVLMMSDTPMERRTNWEVVREARGDVLVAGLGLGLILYPMLVNPEVRSITVVEKSRDVIGLVWPHVVQYRDEHGRIDHDQITGDRYRGPILNVIAADVLTWQPPKGSTWDTLYFDIWPDQSLDNLTQIARLHQRFKARKRAGGWMSSWIVDILRARREEERAYS